MSAVSRLADRCDPSRPDEAPVQTATERSAKLRANRAEAGLKRLELYVHPDDWPAIKALAAKLQRRRTRAA